MSVSGYAVDTDARLAEVTVYFLNMSLPIAAIGQNHYPLVSPLLTAASKMGCPCAEATMGSMREIPRPHAYLCYHFAVSSRQ